MYNSNSKFKWHYLIIASIMLGILASFFVIGAYAEEPTSIAEPSYPDDLYIVTYSADYSYSSNWFKSLVNEDVIIINNPNYITETIRIKPLNLRYTTANGLYFDYSVYDSTNETCNIVSAPWQPYYALYGYFYEDLLNDIHYTFLFNSTEYSYPLTVGTSYSLRDITNLCFVNNNDSLQMDFNFSVYSSLNNTYYGSFNYFLLNAETGYIQFANTYDEHMLSLHYTDSFYITIDEPITSVNYQTDVPNFAYYFLPYTPTETPIANPFTSIADFVTDFISTIIDGLGSLEFYPGVSLLTLLYCFVGILLVRYLLKLIAGG